MPHPRTWQRLRRLGILCILLLPALIVAELLLRSRHPYALGSYVWPPHWRALVETSAAATPGITGPARIAIDGNGLRAPAAAVPGSRRILVLGAGPTFGMHLDQGETWPAQLSRQLEAKLQRPVWVGSAARPGLTMTHQALVLGALQERLQGVELVLCLAGASDLLHDLRLPPTTNAAADREGLLSEQAFTLRPLPNQGQGFRQTALWRVLRYHPWAQHLYAAREGARTRSLEDLTAWRTRYQSASRQPVLPDRTAALDNYGQAVARCIDAAHAAQTRFILITQPALWHAGLSPQAQQRLWQGYGGGEELVYYTPAALEKGLAQYNATLLVVAHAQAVETIDLASVLPRTGEHFTDDTHFTEEGAATVAALLADRLAPSLNR